MLSGRTVSLLSVHPGIEPQVVQKKLEDFHASPKSASDKIIVLAIDNVKVAFAFARRTCVFRCRARRRSKRSTTRPQAHPGIAMKMLAFSHFLTSNPDFAQQVVLKQVTHDSGFC